MKLWTCLALLSATALGSKAEEFASHDGVKIHYAVQGSGTPVLLIHGLHGSASANWARPGITAALAQGHRVVAMDARGHGDSGKPVTDADYGVAMVEDVIALLDRLEIRKVRLVGYSMGGMISLKTTVLHPERVHSLLLCGMGWLQEGGKQQDFWEGISGRPRLVGGRSASACMRGMARLAVTEAEVKALKVPAAVIVGSLDPVDRLYVAPLTKVRPDWQVLRIEGAGHINCIFKQEFREAVVQTVARLENR